MRFTGGSVGGIHVNQEWIVKSRELKRRPVESLIRRWRKFEANVDHAAAACVPHDVMIERLADGWGEARQSVALDRAGNMIETYANLNTGTWTITVTTPGGPTCIIGAGQAFELVAATADVER